MIKQKKLTAAVIASLASLYGAGALAQEQEVEEVFIQGIRASLSAASDLKRDSNVIQDSIVAEDIGKFPDQNVAESLQRITGVSISRVNGEGSQVSVRSFGPEFNIVKLNDRTLATTTGGRSFDFQLLPSELIGGADVIKTPTADLAAGSVGAYVNVRTARPLDNEGFQAAGSAKMNYHGLSQDMSPELSAVVSNTFADDTVGVLVGVSHKQTEGRIDTYRASMWDQYGRGYDSGFSGFGMSLVDDWREAGYATYADGTSLVTLDGEGNPLVNADGQYVDTNGNLVGARGPGRTIFNMTDESRERTGINAVVQWQPNENFLSTVDVLYTTLERNYLGSGPQFPNQEDWAYSSEVISEQGTLLSATMGLDPEMNVITGEEESTTTAFGYNGVFTSGALTLEFDISHSTAESDWEGDDTTALHYSRFDADGNTLDGGISVDYSTDVPSIGVTGGYDLTDISKVRPSWQHYEGSSIEDEVNEIKLDALYDIDAGVVQSVKLGTAYSDRAMSSKVFGTEFDPETGGETWVSDAFWIYGATSYGDSDIIGEMPAGILAVSDNNFMDGVSGNFPRQWVRVADWNAYSEYGQSIAEYMATLPGEEWRNTDIINAGWDTLYESAGGTYVNKENTLETYLQVNLEGELGDKAWAGNVGGRYVTIDKTTAGRASTIDVLNLSGASDLETGLIKNEAQTSATFSEVSTTERHFLPSANFSLDFNNGNYLRTAAAKTITRPALSDAGADVSESAGVDSPTITISGGNPYLTSYEVTQFDLSFEHYADNGSAYSVGYFYKDISNFISTITTIGQWDGALSDELLEAYGGTSPVTFNDQRKANRPGGTVQGLEFGALHYFDNLPGLFSGLGVQANYTYANSKDDAAAPINAPGVVEPGNALEGFAKNSYNLVGFYDKDGIQARIAYNWRDSFMNSRSGDGLQPEYTDAYGQLDMSVSYDITENFTASFEAINLTNETRLQYLGQRDRVNYVEMSGSRFQFGVRATF